jgi:dihydrolipoamide dehydrogenase
MSRKIIILGAGPGGYIGAIRAAQLGARVTVIEDDRLGGTCLNWGCIPTKTIRATAEAMETARSMSEFGLVLDGTVKPDMKAVMARKDKVVDTLVLGLQKTFDRYHIELIEGVGSVLDPGRVRVEKKDGRTMEVSGDSLILAPGSKPRTVNDLLFNGEGILSSDQALRLDEVPEEMVIVGGGVVGSEFGFIFNELGTRVVIVEAMDRVVGLPSVDLDSSKILQREMKKKKIKLHLNKVVTRTEPLPGGRTRVVLGPSPFLNKIGPKDKKEVELSADKVLVTVGRESKARGLGLEALGIELDPAGWIKANKKMETNIPGVYAVGDALGPEKIMLAHAASAEAIIAVENALGGDRAMNYDRIPTGIFTFPEIAGVGVTEVQAEERGYEFRSDTFLLRGLGKAQAMGRIAGQTKIISHAKTGKILGVHIVGPHASDLIAEAALALELGATVKDLASTIHVHPTLSEAIAETAYVALDMPFHPKTKS